MQFKLGGYKNKIYLFAKIFLVLGFKFGILQKLIIYKI